MGQENEHVFLLDLDVFNAPIIESGNKSIFNELDKKFLLLVNWQLLISPLAASFDEVLIFKFQVHNEEWWDSRVVEVRQIFHSKDQEYIFIDHSLHNFTGLTVV